MPASLMKSPLERHARMKLLRRRIEYRAWHGVYANTLYVLEPFHHVTSTDNNFQAKTTKIATLETDLSTLKGEVTPPSPLLESTACFSSETEPTEKPKAWLTLNTCLLLHHCPRRGSLTLLLAVLHPHGQDRRSGERACGCQRRRHQGLCRRGRQPEAERSCDVSAQGFPGGGEQVRRAGTFPPCPVPRGALEGVGVGVGSL
jgi:hypothetical protein